MSSYLSLNALLHLGGVIAISQLILSSQVHHDFYQSLDHNATGYLHEALDKLAVVFQPISFGGGPVGVGTVLRALVYLCAALYALFLARLAVEMASLWLTS